MTADREFLNWVADRFVNVLGESEHVDFVRKLRSIAKATPLGRDTPALLDEAAPALTGSEMIHSERVRQILDEGFDAEHDDAHTEGEMAAAAAVYALHAVHQVRGFTKLPGAEYNARFISPRTFWPSDWDDEWYRTGTPVEDLVKAGALIAAEVDRLLRRREAGEYAGTGGEQ